MMNKTQSLALATLVSLGALSNAQAARLDLMNVGTAVDVIEQSATVDGETVSRSVSDALVDDSTPGTVLLSDFQTYGPEGHAGLSVEGGHTHLVSLDATGARTALTLDASHVWSATGTGSLQAYSLVQSLSVEGLSLRVVGDAGEAMGQRVHVQFDGSADALISGLTGTHDLGLTLDVLRGNDTLVSFNGLWAADAAESFSLGFEAMVGDELTLVLSAYQGITTEPGRALSGMTELGGQLLLQGEFAVAAVPEPATWGLALAGLMVAASAARRRTC